VKTIFPLRLAAVIQNFVVLEFVLHVPNKLCVVSIFILKEKKEKSAQGKCRTLLISFWEHILVLGIIMRAYHFLEKIYYEHIWFRIHDS
jgi:hypothetical protein